MAKVVGEHLYKRYGEVEAVRDFHLEVQDQEFVVLVGPSGCGKTTTLRMVAGFEEVTEGVIRLGDRVINDVEPKDRDIAMVFQNYALYPHMTVYGNMAFGLQIRRLRREEIDRRVKEAAEILGIGELLTRKPRELSGGQRQRVALGRALVREPQAFLMDEPLSNLDAKLRVQTRTEIKKLHSRLKATVLYVTHDQTEAMTMADRIVVMRNGVIQQVAAPQEVYSRPTNQFVAGFIGSPGMNFLRGRLEQDGGVLNVVGEGFRLPVPEDRIQAAEGYGKREVVLGVRPEDLSLREGGTSGDLGATIDCSVELVEPTGAETYVQVGVAGNVLTARAGSEYMVPIGSRQTVAVNMSRTHLFDAESELAIR